MVECEFAQTMGTDYYPAVLIDTWWNVNVLNLTDVTNADKSFNRYMVECESYTLVLIDTWWNVNWEKDLFVDGFAKVLIDTWWNVN